MKGNHHLRNKRETVSQITELCLLTCLLNPVSDSVKMFTPGTGYFLKLSRVVYL